MMFDKINFIISKHHKKKLVGIFLIMFFSIFIEMLSIGLILPILNLLFNENYLSQQNQNHLFSTWAEQSSHHQLLEYY